jgi:hypothetical protein
MFDMEWSVVPLEPPQYLVALNPELFQQEQARVRERFENAVEPDRDGCWWADMGPVDGPALGPFRNRTEALGTERGWLTTRPSTR